MRTLLGLSLLALLASCHPTQRDEDLLWSVKVPPQVAHQWTLRFTVETTNPGGELVGDVPYYWKVAWVGEESGPFEGRTSREQTIPVKGGLGTATVHVLTNDPRDKQVEIVRKSFEVVAPPLPAR
jgi:hypothetical protein